MVLTRFPLDKYFNFIIHPVFRPPSHPLSIYQKYALDSLIGLNFYITYIMGSQTQPSEVLFVGSIPLSSASKVFTKSLQAFPSRLRRVPDGETGGRANFIAWQHHVFPIEIIQSRCGGGPLPSTTTKYTLADLKPTGYDDVALASYKTFCELRSAGKIPLGVRFQVSLPTPFSVVRGFIETECCVNIEPLYEDRLLQTLRRIQDSIPASDLSIQWDLPTEIAALEYENGNLEDPYFKAYFTNVKSSLLERLIRLVKTVDTEVPMGFHLCYGDFAHVHFVQPVDAKLLVEMADTIMETLSPIHKVAYIHMPVPKDKIDESYYKPLKSLELGDTLLFLGLVHPKDEEGTKKRIEVAQKVYPKSFGVSTECGLGKTPPEDLESIFQILDSVTTSKGGS